MKFKISKINVILLLFLMLVGFSPQFNNGVGIIAHAEPINQASDRNIQVRAPAEDTSTRESAGGDKWSGEIPKSTTDSIEKAIALMKSFFGDINKGLSGAAAALSVVSLCVFGYKVMNNGGKSNNIVILIKQKKDISGALIAIIFIFAIPYFTKSVLNFQLPSTFIEDVQNSESNSASPRDVTNADASRFTKSTDGTTLQNIVPAPKSSFRQYVATNADKLTSQGGSKMSWEKLRGGEESAFSPMGILKMVWNVIIGIVGFAILMPLQMVAYCLGVVSFYPVSLDSSMYDSNIVKVFSGALENKSYLGFIMSVDTVASALNTLTTIINALYFVMKQFVLICMEAACYYYGISYLIGKENANVFQFLRRFAEGAIGILCFPYIIEFMLSMDSYISTAIGRVTGVTVPGFGILSMIPEADTTWQGFTSIVVAISLTITIIGLAKTFFIRRMEIYIYYILSPVVFLKHIMGGGNSVSDFFSKSLGAIFINTAYAPLFAIVSLMTQMANDSASSHLLLFMMIIGVLVFGKSVLMKIVDIITIGGGSIAQNSAHAATENNLGKGVALATTGAALAAGVALDSNALGKVKAGTGKAIDALEKTRFGNPVVGTGKRVANRVSNSRAGKFTRDAGESIANSRVGKFARGHTKAFTNNLIDGKNKYSKEVLDAKLLDEQAKDLSRDAKLKEKVFKSKENLERSKVVSDAINSSNSYSEASIKIADAMDAKRESYSQLKQSKVNSRWISRFQNEYGGDDKHGKFNHKRNEKGEIVDGQGNVVNRDKMNPIEKEFYANQDRMIQNEKLFNAKQRAVLNNDYGQVDAMDKLIAENQHEIGRSQQNLMKATASKITVDKYSGTEGALNDLSKMLNSTTVSVSESGVKETSAMMQEKISQRDTTLRAERARAMENNDTSKVAALDVQIKKNEDNISRIAAFESKGSNITINDVKGLSSLVGMSSDDTKSVIDNCFTVSGINEEKMKDFNVIKTTLAASGETGGIFDEIKNINTVEDFKTTFKTGGDATYNSNAALSMANQVSRQRANANRAYNEACSNMQSISDSSESSRMYNNIKSTVETLAAEHKMEYDNLSKYTPISKERLDTVANECIGGVVDDHRFMSGDVKKSNVMRTRELLAQLEYVYKQMDAFDGGFEGYKQEQQDVKEMIEFAGKEGMGDNFTKPVERGTAREKYLSHPHKDLESQLRKATTAFNNRVVAVRGEIDDKYAAAGAFSYSNKMTFSDKQDDA